jgi:seryl-tRNA synthetase
MARRRKKGATLSWQGTKRAYTRYRKWDAKRRKENNKLARDRQAASKTIAAEKAAAAREKDQKAKGRADAKAKRIKDAEAREKALGAARARVVRAQLSTPIREAPASRPAATPSSSRAVAVTRPAGVCGAKTEDGTPCQRLGECGIHRPKNRPSAAPRRESLGG